MSKKHFIALADKIKWENQKGLLQIFNPLAIHALADFCSSQNPQFNRNSWLGYIAGTNGPGGEKIK